jgi:hypothetical protein
MEDVRESLVVGFGFRSGEQGFACSFLLLPGHIVIVVIGESLSYCLIIENESITRWCYSSRNKTYRVPS